MVMVNENKVAELADYHLSPMEFIKVKIHDGMDLNAWMIKPANFDPAKKYPALVYTYGGPHAQIVMNQWGGATFLWHQMMAQKGFVIFALDNRGSAGRGHLFEEPIHFRFGAQEMSDQRDGAVWLKGQPWVDGTRIGIWGWSYGGHMTLHAMFEDPEDFKAGFAGGPVTDWHYYDTIYTERYIGLLPENEESYQIVFAHRKSGAVAGETADRARYRRRQCAFCEHAIVIGQADRAWKRRGGAAISGARARSFRSTGAYFPDEPGDASFSWRIWPSFAD